MKNLIQLFIALCFVLSFSTSRANQITIQDQAGRDVTIKQPVERVVTTFIPATIFALCAGLGDKLVGASTKDTTSSIYEALIPKNKPPVLVGNRTIGVNLETIASLHPDLVILYGQKDGVRLANRLTKLGFPAVVIVPETFAGMTKSLAIIGEATGQQKHTDKVIAAMTEIVLKVQQRVVHKEKPSVYYATSNLLRTVSGDMLQNEMITFAGGRNVSEQTKGFFISISREQFSAWNPDIILCSDRLPTTEIARINSPEFMNITARKENNIFRVPQETYWDFPSPLAMAGLLWMSDKIHPEASADDTLQQEIDHYYDTIFGEGFSKKFPNVVGNTP